MSLESVFKPGNEVCLADKARRAGQTGCVVQVVYSQPVVYVVEWNDSSDVEEYGDDELELARSRSSMTDAEETCLKCGKPCVLPLHRVYCDECMPGRGDHGMNRLGDLERRMAVLDACMVIVFIIAAIGFAWILSS